MSWENEIVMRDITKASVVVSDRIGRDVSAQLDLEEALEASRYTSHPYSTHPREWPPLVEVVDSRELPSALLERYNSAGGEGTALCRIFPEIRRAWASVDNSLFLWRFDNWWVVPNVFKFGAVDPIVEMGVDNESHILYAHIEEMKIQVYSLGPNGDGPLKKVTEEKNLINQRDSHNGGRQGTGSRTPARSTKASIVSISPLSTVESKRLHLVVILKDGNSTFSNNLQKPSCLKVVTTRPAPPLGVGGGGLKMKIFL